jgi:metal-responsive CopG/Arc/MetJ family transcriptional regulator
MKSLDSIPTEKLVQDRNEVINTLLTTLKADNENNQSKRILGVSLYSSVNEGIMEMHTDRSRSKVMESLPIIKSIKGSTTNREEGNRY